ncbi:hypothetical protein ACHAPT_013524 [Fusarium lateritium]
MRASFLLSLALGLLTADGVAASLCRLRSSDTSSVASSTMSYPSASSTAESLSPTESLSTEESTSTTGSASTSGPSSATTFLSLTLSSSLDLSSTSANVLTTTTTSESSTVETSTSAPATTGSTAPFDPIPTFKVVAIGGPVPGAVLKSTGLQGDILTFNPTYSGTRVLSFSLEHSTGRLRESNGMYMCLVFFGYIPTVTVCGAESDGTKYITCKVMTDLTLSCTGPDGHRYMDDEGEEHFYETGATVDYFYVRWGGQGYYSYIGGADAGAAGFLAVKYGLEEVN